MSLTHCTEGHSFKKSLNLPGIIYNKNISVEQNENDIQISLCLQCDFSIIFTLLSFIKFECFYFLTQLLHLGKSSKKHLRHGVSFLSERSTEHERV